MHIFSATVFAFGLGLIAVAPGAQAIRATSVIRFTVPSHLPSQAIKGSCESSRAAWFRDDSARCMASGNSWDPCFRTPADGQWLCSSDPRKPDAAVLLVASAPLARSEVARGAAHGAWFLELTDGTTCRPLAEAGREVEGLAELYTCRFGSDGQADAVLGDFDTSAPVWTIRKVLINKKTEPQTIKSFVMAPVKTVWQ